jgi:hypothetical protein
MTSQCVSSSHDSIIKVWNRDLKIVDVNLTEHKFWVNALTVLSDRHLLSGSDDKFIKLWDLTTKPSLATLTGHNDSVLALKLLPDGRVVSGSKDNTVKVWDVGLRVLRLQELQPLFDALIDYLNIKRLNLQHSALTDQDVPALITLLKNSAITSLDIRQTQITQTGAQQLLEVCQQLDRAIAIRLDNRFERILFSLLAAEKYTRKEMQIKLDVQAKQLAELQRAFFQLATHPESLHRLVQLGDVAATTLKGLLVENAPATTARDIKLDSKLDNKDAPVSVAPKEPDPVEKQEKVMKDHKPLKDSKALAALDQKYAVPTPTAAFATQHAERDLEGMSFILIADAFREHQSALEKRGALFTIQTLEEAAQHYLKQPSTSENQRYLKQLHADINLLLQAWQRDQLTNQAARDMLDERALNQLMKEQKQNSLSPTLQKPVDDYIQAQKQKRFNDWEARRCDEKSHPDLELNVARELYKTWNGQPDEKHPLYADIKRQQHALLQEEAFRRKSLAASTLASYLERMRKEIIKTTTENATTDPRFPENIILILTEALDKEFNQCRVKRGVRVVLSPKPLYEEAANSLLLQWQAGTLDKAVAEALYKLSAYRIGVGAFVTADERKQIFLNAIVSVLADYRQNRLEKEPAEALAQAVKPIFLNPILSEQEQHEEQREGFKYLLAEWKAGHLSKENEIALTVLLTREWKTLQQRMQQQFEPVTQGMLEATIQRVVEQRLTQTLHTPPVVNPHDAKFQPPPAIVAAPSRAPMSQLISSFSIHAPLPITPSQPPEGTPASHSHPSEEGQPQPDTAPTPQH